MTNKVGNIIFATPQAMINDVDDGVNVDDCIVDLKGQWLLHPLSLLL